MYKSDLLTYSHFTRTLTPDEGLRFLRGYFGGHGLEGSVFERSAVTFVPEGDPLGPEGPDLQACASE